MKDITSFILENIKQTEIEWEGIKLTQYWDRSLNRNRINQMNYLKEVTKKLTKTEIIPPYKFIYYDYDNDPRIRLIVKYEDKDKMKDFLSKHTGNNKEYYHYSCVGADGKNDEYYCWHFE